MPLVAHNGLPAFQWLEGSGLAVLPPGRGGRPARELHIGLLNMMPDAALSATEQQFIGFVGACGEAVDFYVYPFSIRELDRGTAALEHINKYYATFDELKSAGLDALIITGANVANPRLDQEAFWEPLIDVVRWGERNVASILCSCLATHALLKYHHGIERQPLPQKRWGVYEHRIIEPAHPLVRNIGGSFDAPHSRYNEISREQLEASGLTVLAESPEAGVHLAVSPDGCRAVYFQGHPEYQGVSLLKEYKREVFRFIDGELDEPPPHPEHYFTEEARGIAGGFIDRCRAALDNGDELPEFPEPGLERHVRNTWHETGQTMIDNWLGLVCELADTDRKRQFRSGVDPDKPLAFLER